MSLSSVQFLSVAEFRKLRPRLDIAVVSILDNEERGRNPFYATTAATQRPLRLGGFASVLELSFEDTSESMMHVDGLWPDEPTDAEHAAHAQRLGERIPALSDAVRIVDFVEVLRSRPEPLLLVAHCRAGLGRSAAVAKWVASRHQVPLDTDMTMEFANERLLRLLDLAWSRSQLPANQ